MLKTISKRLVRVAIRTQSTKKSCSTLPTNIDTKPSNTASVTLNNTEIDLLDMKFEKRSVLSECKDDISHVAPFLRPTFNFAAYINKSETLQQLVKLGVNLSKLEKDSRVPPIILKLDFEKDVKKYIQFLNDLKVEDIGGFITKNPYIFQEDIEYLLVRINYLRFKKFDCDMITRIISTNPKCLSFSTQEIDSKLGFFQKEYKLTGNEVRYLATKQPKLITYSVDSIKTNTFTIKEEMGFTPEELKSIILHKPTVLMKDRKFMLKTFDYVHNTMKIPLEMISQDPTVLTCREFRVRQRHMFLEKLQRAQYNPKMPNYVSLSSLISGYDEEFVEKVAKSSIQAYNTFLKTL